MRTCLTMECRDTVWYGDADNFCSSCGNELFARPTCGACGSVLYDLKGTIRETLNGKKSFCRGCGQAWTSATLGKVMAGSLQGVLDQLARSN